MKDQLNVSIEIELLKEFRRLTEKKAVNKSKLIENYITSWLEDNKEKDD